MCVNFPTLLSTLKQAQVVSNRGSSSGKMSVSSSGEDLNLPTPPATLPPDQQQEYLKLKRLLALHEKKKRKDQNDSKTQANSAKVVPKRSAPSSALRKGFPLYVKSSSAKIVPAKPAPTATPAPSEQGEILPIPEDVNASRKTPALEEYSSASPKRAVSEERVTVSPNRAISVEGVLVSGGVVNTCPMPAVVEDEKVEMFTVDEEKVRKRVEDEEKVRKRVEDEEKVRKREDEEKVRRDMEDQKVRRHMEDEEKVRRQMENEKVRKHTEDEEKVRRCTELAREVEGLHKRREACKRSEEWEQQKITALTHQLTDCVSEIAEHEQSMEKVQAQLAALHQQLEVGIVY